MKVLGEDLPIDESTYEDAVGGILRDLREDEGVSIDDVAESGPYNVDKLQLIEQGQITPGEAVLLTYAVALSEHTDGVGFRDFIDSLVRRLLS